MNLFTGKHYSLEGIILSIYEKIFKLSSANDSFSSLSALTDDMSDTFILMLLMFL